MLLNLTYTIPPIFALSYDIQKNAIQENKGEGFNPTTGEVPRSKVGYQRWIHGFFSGGKLQIAVNIWHIVYALASLSLCGLGMYGAIAGK